MCRSVEVKGNIVCGRHHFCPGRSSLTKPIPRHSLVNPRLGWKLAYVVQLENLFCRAIYFQWISFQEFVSHWLMDSMTQADLSGMDRERVTSLVGHDGAQ